MSRKHILFTGFNGLPGWDLECWDTLRSNFLYPICSISYTQGQFIPLDFQHVKNYHKNTMAFRSPESCLTLHFLWVPICVPDWWLLHSANQGRPTKLPCSPQAQVLYLWEEGFLCPHVQLISQWFTASCLECSYYSSPNSTHPPEFDPNPVSSRRLLWPRSNFSLLFLISPCSRIL